MGKVTKGGVYGRKGRRMKAMGTKNISVFFIGLSLAAFVSSCSPATGRGMLELSGRIEGGVRAIEIKASRYKFEPDPITVKLGEKVRLTATSLDVPHGIAIPEFKVKMEIPVGRSESVEFIADKEGTFHAHCSVYCGPGHAHMHAGFIVKK